MRSAAPGLTFSIGLALLALSAAAMPVGAQTLFNQVQTIAAATTGVPVQESFSVTAAGSYTITLTDLGAALTPPAPLASVKLAVTNSSDALVGSVLVGAGTLTLSNLAPDTYQIHVVGMPGNTPGSGPIDMQVNGPTGGGSSEIADFQDILALPSQALPNGEGVLDGNFQVGTSGNYTVTLADLQLPQSLTTLTLLLVPSGGAPLATLGAAGSTTVALTAGVTYDIFAVGATNATANAGLFSATVAPSGGGTVVFARTVPVGNTLLVGSPALAAGSDTLALTDLKYPAALSQVGAALVLNGQAVASLSAGGSQAFTAIASTYGLYAVGTAATAAPGAGSYAVRILPASGAALFSAARAAVAAGSALTPYSFDTSLPAAGSYNAVLGDFQFPAQLISLRLAAVQNGALVGTPLSAPGTLNVSGAAGPVSLLAFVQAGATGGLFGIDLAPSAGGTAVLQVTQGVGVLFTTHQLTITVARSYAVTATDLGFPANFAAFDTVVTQGTQTVGETIGGGTFNFAATPGTYYVNVIAQAMGADEAGTYALTVAPAPPAPTVSLTVDTPSVSSGSSVDLTWSSQNATTCMASGGWNGAEPINGTATSAALTADTTFTLTCTGPGGSQAQSVKVTVTAASSGGGGGGGQLDFALLALLAAALLTRAAAVTRASSS